MSEQTKQRIDRARNILAVIFVLIWAVLCVWYFVGKSHAQEAPQINVVVQCPAGQYDMGDVCRDEPTGCPYGDSIPLDSPKCVAPPALADGGKLDAVVPQNTEPEIVDTTGK